MTKRIPTKNYDALRMEYAEWLCGPREGTKGDWARDHEVSPQVLSDWAKHPDVVARQDQWKTLIIKPAQADIVNALVREAKKGNVNAASLIGKWMGWEASQKLEVSGKQGLLEWLGAQQPDAPVKRAN